MGVVARSSRAVLAVVLDVACTTVGSFVMGYLKVRLLLSPLFMGTRLLVRHPHRNSSSTGLQVGIMRATVAQSGSVGDGYPPWPKGQSKSGDFTQ